jgi:hypothetical protein
MWFFLPVLYIAANIFTMVLAVVLGVHVDAVGAWVAVSVIVAIDAGRVVDALHDLVEYRQARRRDAQLTWAIRWWERHYVVPEHRVESVMAMLRNRQEKLEVAQRLN